MTDRPDRPDRADRPDRPGLTGSRLDRADALRGDETALAGLRDRPDALELVLHDLDPALDAAGRLSWQPLDQTGTAEIALLGLLDGIPRHVALTDAPPALRRSTAIFAALDAMPPEEASTYAAARSLVDWHARHRFCARCGTATRVIRAGWARACPGCGAEHFPRTDPVVIMLAEHGSGDTARVLVGRQASWPPGRYSALAGFVEVGESIEEAVARELFEEAGVRAGAVRFVASQPWPFPSQLMIACIAAVADDALTLDGLELEAAIWVTRDEVRAALADDPSAPFLAPPPYAIAWTLLDHWAAEAAG